MNTIESIASALAELYRMREEVKYLQWQNERQMEELELELTPADGWEGKNENSRELSKARTLASDFVMAGLHDAEDNLRKQHAHISGNIQANEVNMEALRWNIRLGLVRALGAKCGDVPFDEAGDAAMDDQAFDGIQF